ncbi:MAG: HD domain-containing protein [Dysgonomonas sp.]|nr:HD domain-containing protein [Dysgonomonas sp.]
MKDNKRIVNDPVFGFITIPNDFVSSIIDHPFLQRLSRIKQMGMASFAFPGAQHTRFHHTLGAMYLMQEVITDLRTKGNEITEEEANGALACILLHDVGHGPFSHVLEHTIVNGVHHEEISLMLMHKLNEELNGKLDICISIFKDEYPKKFLHQLVSGQLDVDRLDYLRRDCFFTGVSEGNIGSERIIRILDVRDNKLVVESKGIYSIENFLLSRRLMYWQVYHHKTAIAAENILINILKRAKELTAKGETLFASPSLNYFLQNDINKSSFDDETLKHFVNLDDSDILSALKVWTSAEDKVLSALSSSFLNRHLFKIEVLDEPADEKRKKEYIKKYAEHCSISEHEASFFISSGTITTNIYNHSDNSIDILYKNGEIKSISEVSDLLNIQLLSKKAEKYYFSYMNI